MCLSESSPQGCGDAPLGAVWGAGTIPACHEQGVNYLSILGSNKLVLTMTSLSGAPILPPGDIKVNEMIPAK